mmetsp:Transcript_96573/g.249695  ORF Transcript_96573/g.249695 Transcript_96573/m.249695 type:complete len:373 (+) Transcript_96573:54-1172(+)
MMGPTLPGSSGRPHFQLRHRRALVREYAEDPELQQKVNAIAYAHHLIFNGHAANFICNYLDDDFKGAFQAERRSRVTMVVTLSMFFGLVTALPPVYGQYLMTDPCRARTALIDDHMEQFAEVGCSVQAFMESNNAGLMGPVALAFVFVFRVKYMVALMIRLRVRRTLKKARMIIYSWVRHDLWKLWYQPFNDDGNNHALHSVVGLYFCVLIEFLAVGILLRDGVALAIGYGAAKGLLLISNILLAPTDMRIEMINAELRHCNEDAVEVGLMLDRLRRNTSSVFFINSTELNSFYKMPNVHGPMQREEYYWYGSKSTDEDHSMDDMSVDDFESPIRRLYLSDKNLAVDVKPSSRDDASESSSESGTEHYPSKV